MGSNAAAAGATAVPRYVSPVAALKNSQSVGFVRGMFAALTAIGIGILGVTGSAGFLAYLVTHAVASFALLAAMKMSPSKYFAQQTVPGFLLSGIGDNLILFIFAWTLAYAMVHIY
jgi:hypothetical protein